MKNKRRRRSINFGAFITTIAVFTIVALTLTWSLQAKSKEVRQVNQILQTEQEEKEKLKITIEEMQKQNKEMNDQLEDLKNEIEELQLKNTATVGPEKESKEKIAYLTFDDGPSDNTPKILDILKEKDIKATFFVIGNENRKDVYKRIVDEGHTLGNHTYGHDYNGIYKSPETFFADVEKLNDLLEEATGQRSKILRFPGGSNNTVSRHSGGSGIMSVMTEAVVKDGYRYFDWNVDSLDAAKGKQSKDVIVKSVLDGASYTNKAVVLMHDAPAKTTTVDALPEIIDGLTSQGFIFKGLDADSPEIQF